MSLFPFEIVYCRVDNALAKYQRSARGAGSIAVLTTYHPDPPLTYQRLLEATGQCLAAYRLQIPDVWANMVANDADMNAVLHAVHTAASTHLQSALDSSADYNIASLSSQQLFAIRTGGKVQEDVNQLFAQLYFEEGDQHGGEMSALGAKRITSISSFANTSTSFAPPSSACQFALNTHSLATYNNGDITFFSGPSDVRTLDRRQQLLLPTHLHTFNSVDPRLSTPDSLLHSTLGAFEHRLRRYFGSNSGDEEHETLYTAYPFAQELLLQKLRDKHCHVPRHLLSPLPTSLVQRLTSTAHLAMDLTNSKEDYRTIQRRQLSLVYADKVLTPLVAARDNLVDRQALQSLLHRSEAVPTTSKQVSMLGEDMWQNNARSVQNSGLYPLPHRNTFPGSDSNNLFAPHRGQRVSSSSNYYSTRRTRSNNVMYNAAVNSDKAKPSTLNGGASSLVDLAPFLTSSSHRHSSSGAADSTLGLLTRRSRSRVHIAALIDASAQIHARHSHPLGGAVWVEEVAREADHDEDGEEGMRDRYGYSNHSSGVRRRATTRTSSRAKRKRTYRSEDDDEDVESEDTDAQLQPTTSTSSFASNGNRKKRRNPDSSSSSSVSNSDVEADDDDDDEYEEGSKRERKSRSGRNVSSMMSVVHVEDSSGSGYDERCLNTLRLRSAIRYPADSNQHRNRSGLSGSSSGTYRAHATISALDSKCQLQSLSSLLRPLTTSNVSGATSRKKRQKRDDDDQDAIAHTTNTAADHEDAHATSSSAPTADSNTAVHARSRSGRGHHGTSSSSSASAGKLRWRAHTGDGSARSMRDVAHLYGAHALPRRRCLLHVHSADDTTHTTSNDHDTPRPPPSSYALHYLDYRSDAQRESVSFVHAHMHRSCDVDVAGAHCPSAGTSSSRLRSLVVQGAVSSHADSRGDLRQETGGVKGGVRGSVRGGGGVSGLLPSDELVDLVREIALEKLSSASTVTTTTNTTSTTATLAAAAESSSAPGDVLMDHTQTSTDSSSTLHHTASSNTNITANTAATTIGAADTSGGNLYASGTIASSKKDRLLFLLERFDATAAIAIAVIVEELCDHWLRRHRMQVQVKPSQLQLQSSKSISNNTRKSHSFHPRVTANTLFHLSSSASTTAPSTTSLMAAVHAQTSHTSTATNADAYVLDAATTRTLHNRIHMLFCSSSGSPLGHANSSAGSVASVGRRRSEDLFHCALRVLRVAKQAATTQGLISAASTMTNTYTPNYLPPLGSTTTSYTASYTSSSTSLDATLPEPSYATALETVSATASAALPSNNVHANAYANVDTNGDTDTQTIHSTNSNHVAQDAAKSIATNNDATISITNASITSAASVSNATATSTASTHATASTTSTQRAFFTNIRSQNLHLLYRRAPAFGLAPHYLAEQRGAAGGAQGGAKATGSMPKAAVKADQHPPGETASVDNDEDQRTQTLNHHTHDAHAASNSSGHRRMRANDDRSSSSMDTASSVRKSSGASKNKKRNSSMSTADSTSASASASTSDSTAKVSKKRRRHDQRATESEEAQSDDHATSDPPQRTPQKKRQRSDQTRIDAAATLPSSTSSHATDEEPRPKKQKTTNTGDVVRHSHANHRSNASTGSRPPENAPTKEKRSTVKTSEGTSISTPDAKKKKKKLMKTTSTKSPQHLSRTASTSAATPATAKKSAKKITKAAKKAEKKKAEKKTGKKKTGKKVDVSVHEADETPSTFL